MEKENLKIVVFDLDETLGYFTQFGTICDSLNSIFNSQNFCYENFNELLDLYQDFYLRPKILKILNYLKEKKENNQCYKVMIYTNNQGPKKWTVYLKNYFVYKLGNYNLFDQIIAAFKINGRQVEPNRSSHEKNMKDFYQCTKIPENVEICFIDDQYHPGMKDKKVYYINLKPYYFNLSSSEIIDIFMKSRFAKMIKKEDEEKVKQNIKNYIDKYKDRITSKDKIKIHRVVSKKVFQHLKLFFGETHNKTLKKKKY